MSLAESALERIVAIATKYDTAARYPNPANDQEAELETIVARIMDYAAAARESLVELRKAAGE